MVKISGSGRRSKAVGVSRGTPYDDTELQARVTAAFETANIANVSFANVAPAFDQANSAYDLANNAFIAANNAVTDYSPAFIQANSAYEFANTVNTEFGSFQTTYTTYQSLISSQFNTVNNSLDTINNTIGNIYNIAVGAFGLANTNFSANGGTISGNVTVTGDITGDSLILPAGSNFEYGQWTIEQNSSNLLFYRSALDPSFPMMGMMQKVFALRYDGSIKFSTSSNLYQTKDAGVKRFGNTIVQITSGDLGGNGSLVLENLTANGNVSVSGNSVIFGSRTNSTEYAFDVNIDGPNYYGVRLAQGNGTRFLTISGAGGHFNTTWSLGSGITWRGAASFEVTNAIGSRVGIGVWGYSGQTADLYQARNSSSTVLFNVDANGAIGTASSITANSDIYTANNVYTGNTDLAILGQPTIPRSNSQYILPYGFTGYLNSSISISVPTWVFKVPFYNPTRRNFTETSVLVKTAGGPGALTRWGLRKWNRNVPVDEGMGELMFETAQMNVESTGTITETIDVTLDPGWYLYEINTNDTDVRFAGANYLGEGREPVFGWDISTTNWIPISVIGTGSGSTALADGFDAALAANGPTHFNVAWSTSLVAIGIR
jgi:hypothetical protein